MLMELLGTDEGATEASNGIDILQHEANRSVLRSLRDNYRSAEEPSLLSPSTNTQVLGATTATEDEIATKVLGAGLGQVGHLVKSDTLDSLASTNFERIGIAALDNDDIKARVTSVEPAISPPQAAISSEATTAASFINAVTKPGDTAVTPHSINISAVTVQSLSALVHVQESHQTKARIAAKETKAAAAGKRALTKVKIGAQEDIEDTKDQVDDKDIEKRALHLTKAQIDAEEAKTATAARDIKSRQPHLTKAKIAAEEAKTTAAAYDIDSREPAARVTTAIWRDESIKVIPTSSTSADLRITAPDSAPAISATSSKKVPSLEPAVLPNAVHASASVPSTVNSSGKRACADEAEPKSLNRAKRQQTIGWSKSDAKFIGRTEQSTSVSQPKQLAFSKSTHEQIYTHIQFQFLDRTGCRYSGKAPVPMSFKISKTTILRNCYMISASILEQEIMPVYFTDVIVLPPGFANPAINAATRIISFEGLLKHFFKSDRSIAKTLSISRKSNRSLAEAEYYDWTLLFRGFLAWGNFVENHVDPQPTTLKEKAYFMGMALLLGAKKNYHRKLLMVRTPADSEDRNFGVDWAWFKELAEDEYPRLKRTWAKKDS
ncbi:hypothetical protein B7494_g7145 [Chlorociboria aeruginascens]|nr:hypothetical protein B7494_g7145 [Chlorociboria aeruginascens]